MKVPPHRSDLTQDQCHLRWLGLRVLLCALLVSAFWTTLGTMLGCRISREDVRASATSLLVLPATLAASVFYNIGKTPAFIRLMGAVNPAELSNHADQEPFLGVQYQHQYQYQHSVSCIAICRRILCVGDRPLLAHP